MVDALLECLAPFTQVLDHMARSPGAPDVQSIVGVLRRLLLDVLAPRVERFAARDLATAAEIVDAATEAIVGDLYMVPHSRKRADSRRRRSPKTSHRRRRP
jgi:hypothetical protein